MANSDDVPASVQVELVGQDYEVAPRRELLFVVDRANIGRREADSTYFETVVEDDGLTLYVSSLCYRVHDESGALLDEF